MAVIFNEPADPVNYRIIEVVQRGHVVGNNSLLIPVFNVFHFRRTAGIVPGNPAGLLTALQAVWGGNVAGALSDSYVLDEAGARPLDDESVPEVVDTGGVWGSGTISGDDSPTMNAASFQLVTDGRGRCFRGRKHLGPVPESSTTQNLLVAGGLALLNSASTAFLTAAGGVSDGSGNTYNFVVLSRKNSILVGTGINFTTASIIDVICNPVVGSMDRRKERR